MNRADNIETEIKLVAASPDILERLAGLPLVRECLVAGSERTKEMEACYYDTPKRRLAKAGAIYRVRREPDGYVATVKMESSNSGGLSERLEYNVPLLDEKPKIDGFSGINFLLDLPKLVGKERLEKLFTVAVVRQQFELVVSAQTRIEAAIDHGHIIAGDKTLAVDEVEFEIIEGSRADLLGFIAQLAGEETLYIEHKSKYYRGCQLIGEGALLKDNGAGRTDSEQPLKDFLLKLLKEKIGNMLFLLSETAVAHEKSSLLAELTEKTIELQNALDFLLPLFPAPECDRRKGFLHALADGFSAAADIGALVGEWQRLSAKMRGVQSTATWTDLLKEKQQATHCPNHSAAVLFSLWAWLERQPWLDEVQPDREDFFRQRTLECLDELLQHWQRVSGEYKKHLPALLGETGKLLHGLGLIGKELPKDLRKVEKAAEELHDSLLREQVAEKTGQRIFSLFKASGGRLLYRDAGILYGWLLKSEEKKKNGQAEKYLSDLQKYRDKLRKRLEGNIEALGD